MSLRSVRRGTKRARELAVNLSVTLSTAVAHLTEDPLLFALQAARRLPRPMVRTAGAALGGPGAGPLRTALSAWLLDHPAEARQALAALPVARRRGRRLADELGVQLGMQPHPDAHPTVLARAAWLRGDLSAGVTIAGSSPALRRRHEASRALLAGDLTPRQPRIARYPRGGEPAALHVLVNSVPHTQSGYASRSHAVLRAQAAEGIRVAAATRIGYPVSVGRLGAHHVDTVDGVPYHRLLLATLPRSEPARLQRQVDLLAPLVRAHRPTVLHTTTHHPNAWVTRAAAEAAGLPWVYEVRGLLEDSWAARRAALGDLDAETSEYYGLFRARETEAALAADHVVTLSQTLATELTERGVPAERITIVPNGVDTALLDLPDVAPADAREALGLSRAGFWVGTVSSLVDYEGLDTVLDAVSLLRRRGVDARACIVGDGVARPGLERHANALGLGEHAVFTGRVPRQDAARWHQALDVFTVPRRDVRVCRMVTPLKPVEAMALGRPVVASDLPALAEIVSSVGVAAPPGDADRWADTVEALAESPEQRRALGAAGREFAATRTWSAAGRTYCDLYRRLADAR